ncbi:hypothetical protein [Mycoplasma struthionis]|uniref:Asp23/Gls24 family envelope stress response protein n=1 Tax=Mycoplasma struthionis TaxID=538220 RepID=A0A3G8LGV6_9MOLU|nr:hypothetical protein [Mycoplasma struthionis]AZG68537.1 hypothetical protein EGN60_00930 [Mycoplasma struthionis]TPI02363.1 hypothetical protein FJM01_00740 [Mycoplasma struthionis]
MNLVEIKEIIDNAISSIAGIVEITPLEAENNVDFENTGLIVKTNPKHEDLIDITIGLVIMNNISAKNIVEEIHQIVTYYLAQKSLSLGSLTIYIKGIK